MRIRLLPIFVLAIMALTMTTAVAFADEDMFAGNLTDDQIAAMALPNGEPEMAAQGDFVEDPEGYIRVYKPKNNYVAYSGEKMSAKCSLASTWKNYYTVPVTIIVDAGGNIVFSAKASTAFNSGTKTYTDKLRLKGYDPGSYTLEILAAPCDASGELVDGWTNFDMPYVDISFKVKTLKPPAKLHIVSRTGGRITIDFPKAAGATKYQVYKSTSLYGKYKCIKTGKKRKYLDTKVKKGTTYYYKVRSIRTKHGKVKSDFSSIWYVPGL